MNGRYGIYYAAAAYLLYLVYEVIADIKSGASSNVPFAAGIAGFFSLAAVAILLYAYKKSKAEKAAEEKATAEARQRALAEDDEEEKEEDAHQDESAEEAGEGRQGLR